MIARQKSSHFSDFLNPSQIIFNLKATDKIQALEELLDVLVKQKLIKNKKLILTRLIDRERLDSTGIGHNVALPHARVDTHGKIAIAVGKSREGIEFDSIDEKKVHLIILVVWNPSLPGLFNHLFAGLAQYLRQPRFRQRVFQTKNKSELFNVLSEVELSLPQEDRIVSRASVLWKLQAIEFTKRKAAKSKQKELENKASLIREELDEALVERFNRLMERYGFAVAEVEGGVCQGCNINVATGMNSAIEGSNDIYVCENCGKFLVASKKRKKTHNHS
jgi:mannitol/fructose-specific phosphotransferase system IIA component (Ntr-type)